MNDISPTYRWHFARSYVPARNPPVKKHANLFLQHGELELSLSYKQVVCPRSDPIKITAIRSCISIIS
jgi:hypothetical protein